MFITGTHIIFEFFIQQHQFILIYYFLQILPTELLSDYLDYMSHKSIYKFCQFYFDYQ